ncbi:hypothetical protein [Botrimarina sp.]|uniref:hypothetical protein n=1 Tax=Botrimarina sp. TaxID=2795802 RepID=UPI0032F006A8
MTPLDPTEEIRAIKRKLAAEFGFDVHRIAEDIRRRQAESGRTMSRFRQSDSSNRTLPMRAPVTDA